MVATKEEKQDFVDIQEISLRNPSASYLLVNALRTVFRFNEEVLVKFKSEDNTLNVLTMDMSKIALVHLKMALPSSVEKDYSIGVDSRTLGKVISQFKQGDTIDIGIGDPEHLYVKKRGCTNKLKEIDLDEYDEMDFLESSLAKITPKLTTEFSVKLCVFKERVAEIKQWGDALYIEKTNQYTAVIRGEDIDNKIFAELPFMLPNDDPSAKSQYAIAYLWYILAEWKLKEYKDVDLKLNFSTNQPCLFTIAIEDMELRVLLAPRVKEEEDDIDDDFNVFDDGDSLDELEEEEAND